MTIRILTLVPLFFMALFFMAACQSTSETGQPIDELVEAPSETVDTPPAVMDDGIKGTVRYLELEGGFYGITTEEGQNYLPLNLDEAFQEDSLQVLFTMKVRKDVFTIAMWGQPVEITAIERVEE